MFWTVMVMSLVILAVNSEKFCEKYSNFNSIESHAYISPIIIVGNVTMTFTTGESLRATVQMKKLLKGSLGNWKNNLVIVGDFYESNPTNTNIKPECIFKVTKSEERIFFLEQRQGEEGSFIATFQPVIYTINAEYLIKSVLCNDCSGPPILAIINLSKSPSSIIKFQCRNTKRPEASVMWISNKALPNNVEIHNDILQITNPTKENQRLYECIGANIAGTASTYIYIQTMPDISIKRCAAEDLPLCHGNGQCYSDANNKFCRCKDGFTAPRCTSKSVDKPNGMERKASFDEINCSKNGRAYFDTSLNKIICICNENFYGDTCLLTKSQIRLTKDKDFIRQIKSIINSGTSKNAIIGAFLVVAGSIFVVLVILGIWKCYINKLRAQQAEDSSYENRNVTASQRAPGPDYSIVPMTDNKAPKGPVPPKKQTNGTKDEWQSEIPNNNNLTSSEKL